ncbi:MAG: reverse transcriptase domain-containing protein [Janthinobacterium lividum]
MLTKTDRKTRYVWTSFHVSKKEVVEDIIRWKHRAERDCVQGEKLKKIHIDRGKEFLNNSLQKWADDNNVLLDPTVGYNPEANSIAERCNRTIMECSNTMRCEAGLSEAYWAMATEASTYLHNRGPVAFLKTMTPWEAWYGDKPGAKRYRVWGCPVYVHIAKERRKKLEKKAWKGVFVGYSARHAGIYKIWCPERRKLFEARFVIFDELHSRGSYHELPEEAHSEFNALRKERGYNFEDQDDGEDDSSSGEDDAPEGVPLRVKQSSVEAREESTTTSPLTGENDETPDGGRSHQNSANGSRQEGEMGAQEGTNDQNDAGNRELGDNDTGGDDGDDDDFRDAHSNVDGDTEDEDLEELDDAQFKDLEEAGFGRAQRLRSTPPPPPPPAEERPQTPKPLSVTARKQQERQARKVAKTAAEQQKNELRRKGEYDAGHRRGRSAKEYAQMIRLCSEPRRQHLITEKVRHRPRRYRKEQVSLVKTPLRLGWRIPIPLNTAEALGSAHAEDWQGAMDEEVQAHLRNGTFKPVDRPEKTSDAELLTAKFVFDIKYDEKGEEPLRFKARLVARGFKQIHGVNFEETFAPTMHFDAFRIILAVAAARGWRIRQMDVITAFLAGTLSEVVHLRVPSELRNVFGEYVRVIKSLYGLKQAARVWFLLLQSFLESIGFTSLPSDESIMINQSRVIIGIYVDDLLITGEDNEEIEKVIDQLKKRFPMKDLKEARNVLGMRVLRDGPLLSLDQAKYAAEIVREFYYEDGPIYDTPMDPSAATTLETDPGKPLDSAQNANFLRLVGKLGWLCNTRPEITFAVRKTQQFTSRACSNHWKALLRIVGYVAGTLEYGLVWGLKALDHKREDDASDDFDSAEIKTYVATSKAEQIREEMEERAIRLRINGYSDSDLATDPSDRKSITGQAIVVNGAVVVFGSVKQHGVSKATQTAEYIGMSDTALRVLWVKLFMAKIQGQDELARPTAPILHGDNKAAVALTEGLKSPLTVRHLASSYHHIVDEVTRKKSIVTKWIPGKDMLADGFTKPLPRDAFKEKRTQIGVREITEVMRRALK